MLATAVLIATVPGAGMDWQKLEVRVKRENAAGLIPEFLMEGGKLSS